MQWQKSKGVNGAMHFHVLCVRDEVALTIKKRLPYVYEQLLKAQRAMRAEKEQRREVEEQQRRDAREKHGIARYFLR